LNPGCEMFVIAAAKGLAQAFGFFVCNCRHADNAKIMDHIGSVTKAI